MLRRGSESFAFALDSHYDAKSSMERRISAEVTVSAPRASNELDFVPSNIPN
jgi:hypothetical protein